MPARSKSQQRLFAMVHAYNKGEFHGSRSLRKKVEELSKRISDDDARHFAETKHDGLPERKGEKRADALTPAIISRDVLYGSPLRIVRGSDGVVQVLGPSGNATSDVLVVAEKEVAPLLARRAMAHRSTPSDTDLRRMYDVVQADARLFRRLKALGLLDSIRAGRSVRNRIVHQPGYVPSKADTDRALRDYSDADKKTSKSEKRAQIMIRPDQVQFVYDRAPIGDYAEMMANRSERRRSFLRRVVSGAAIGTVLGGVGAGALGYGLVSHAGNEAGRPPDVTRSAAREAGLRCGLWGAGNGALLGTLTGIGLGVLDKIRR